MTGNISVFVPDGEFGSSASTMTSYSMSIACGTLGFLGSGSVDPAVEFHYADLPKIIAELQEIYDDPRNRQIYSEAG